MMEGKSIISARKKAITRRKQTIFSHLIYQKRSKKRIKGIQCAAAAYVNYTTDEKKEAKLFN